MGGDSPLEFVLVGECFLKMPDRVNRSGICFRGSLVLKNYF